MKTNTLIRSFSRSVVTVAEYDWTDSLGNTYGDSMRLAAPEALNKAQAAKRIREYVKSARITNLYRVE